MTSGSLLCLGLMFRNGFGNTYLEVRKEYSSITGCSVGSKVRQILNVITFDICGRDRAGNVIFF